MTLVERIADAVLYEGYILYPYRPSAVKNQQRWNFGALCPPAFSETQGGTESSTMETECLIQGDSDSALDVRLRFLQLIEREVGEVVADGSQSSNEGGDAQFTDTRGGRGGGRGGPPVRSDRHFRVVPRLEVNGIIFQSWQEAAEREATLCGVKLGELLAKPQQLHFTFPANNQFEDLVDQSTNSVVGVIIRKQQPIDGVIEVAATRICDELFKVRVIIRNLTPLDDAANKSRNEAMLRSLASTHTILTVRDGAFVSLLDPPEAFKEAARECRNVGTYPVLVGEDGARDCLLSSPIILYDYPQIAPESAGNLFDGTEIDEILTLRIMTLTEEEKREMRGADALARAILERTEKLPPEQLMKMHGTMRK